MKKLILIISLLFLSSFGYSQVEPLDTNTVTFTKLEVLNINNYIKDLEDKIKMKDEIIDEYKNNIFYYQRLHYTDSVDLYLANEQIALHNVQIVAYKNLYKSTKQKWYNSKEVGFIYGVATVMGASWVVNNVNK